MFDFSEIQPGDLIKVLVKIDEVEDEQYAIVEENCTDYLIVKYFTERSLSFKGAPVYTLDNETNLLREENVSEHFENGDSIFTCINETDGMYIIENEQQSDAESVLYNESDESGSDADSFIVSDSEIEHIDLPPDHVQIDREWNEWKPHSPGSTRFKQMVDNIELKARIQMDEINF